MNEGSMKPRPRGRRFPVGAEVLPGGNGVHYRVWAPSARRLEVVLERTQPHPDESARSPVRLPLQPEEGGYFSGLVDAAPGALYRLSLDGGDPVPDPAGRFQPDGPHGPSEVIDPAAFAWTDIGWPGLQLRGQVLYELHVGTFTGQGSWAAAAEELAELAGAGITVVELMPVAEFPGRFGWGYDGVDLFAPTHLYGRPDDFRAFVDTAHRHGLGVILDVVYNHLGPDGNHLKTFSSRYFTDRYPNEWGEALDFDGASSAPVREFFCANAAHWISEYHLDGLRLDATQQIYDSSSPHILAEVAQAARRAAGGRQILLVAENEPQDTGLVRSEVQGGQGLDALWNDDLHHSATVALTGRNDAYYSDYRGSPQEFVSAAKHGFLYQGQRYAWQGKRRGSPTFGLAPEIFIDYLQNHDQIANSGGGTRCHLLGDPATYRALTGLLLLLPATPLLFQGQEFAASAPFLYFADHHPELAAKVAGGRLEFLSQFRSLALPEVRERLPLPHDPDTFARSKLDLSERVAHAEVYRLHKDLLRLRREDPVISTQAQGGMEGAVLGAHAFCLRFFGQKGDDRLLLVNLGTDLDLVPAPEPLLAPPVGRCWGIRWSSEDPDYGGMGTPAPESEQGWRLLGRSALLFAPEPAGGQRRGGDEQAKARTREETL
jgi:maltooligosyltrehalose trehalohydrolase